MLVKPLAYIGVLEIEMQPQATLLSRPGCHFAPIKIDRSALAVQ
jgi:hypothetical protein